MGGPLTAIWPLDEHTRGKHLVLKNYLNAWLPILGQRHDRIVFIDGFAGPGVYAGGEPGSPVIALRAIKEHVAKASIRADVTLLFVEADPERFSYLEREVLREAVGLPTNVHVERICGRFDETIGELLIDLDRAADRLAPTFMMVDPFGISGTPMSLLARFLRHPSTEVLITFMVDFIDRFDETREFPPHLDQLFGCSDWLSARGLPGKETRRGALFDLYEKQLRRCGATQVLRLDVWDRQRLIYGLFHASRHPRACAKMKEAIWRACPAGDFAFRGSRGGQLGLELGADFSRLPGEIQGKLRGADWMTIEQLEEWISSDTTLYCPAHLRGGLRHLEEAGSIEVTVNGKRRKGSYPEGRTRIRIKPA